MAMILLIGGDQGYDIDDNCFIDVMISWEKPEQRSRYRD
jgi:hypothetical protein